jgi:hypothetical protein
MTPTQIKKALVASGFEVFRTLSDGVILSERVRENLILDSGIRVRFLRDGVFEVRVIMRVEKRDFPNDSEDELFGRVRELSKTALARGFLEKETGINVVKDPSDEGRTLDSFYELHLTREVNGEWNAVADVLREAVQFEKAVAASRD